MARERRERVGWRMGCGGGGDGEAAASVCGGGLRVGRIWVRKAARVWQIIRVVGRPACLSMRCSRKEITVSWGEIVAFIGVSLVGGEECSVLA